MAVSFGQITPSWKLFEGFRPPNPHDWLKGHLALKNRFRFGPSFPRALSCCNWAHFVINRAVRRGDVDLSFDPGSGVNGPVYTVALQPDGKVIIGGQFAFINGTNHTSIARLNSNGSLDGIFTSGTVAGDFLGLIALQPDGDVLIGGDFLTVNGVLRPHDARLYGDAFAPSLSIARSNAFMIVSWPETGLSFQLQQSTNLALPNSWSPVAPPAATNAGQISVSLSTAVGSRFFRLKSQ